MAILPEERLVLCLVWIAIVSQDLRHDNCTAIILRIVILLSVLSAASSILTSTGEPEWWLNPCDKPTGRHHRSAEGQQLKRFLLILNRSVSKEIADLYKTNDKMRYNGNCPKINKMLDNLNATTSYSSAMQTFYQTLVQFAVFIDKLKRSSVKTHGEFNFAKRESMFENIAGNLKLLICEYNETLVQSGPRYKKRNLNKFRGGKVHKIDTTCLKPEMNQTEAHMMDMIFFKKLRKFLRRSRRILNKKQNQEKRAKKSAAKRTRKQRN